MTSCLLYHRTSLAHGAQEGAERGVLEQLRQAARERDWTVEAEHVDRQERPSDERPAFAALEADLERRQRPLGLLVLSLDRLIPCKLPAAIKRITTWLSHPRHPVRLVTLDEAIDSAAPASWAEIFAALAALLRRQRSEATAAGHALRAARGLALRNVWNDAELRRRYRAGESQREIARAMDVAQSSVCRRFADLREEGYLSEKDEAARQAAHEENPPNRGGRPKKADPASAESP